jgi:archaellum biogenesis ATPase FlaH
MIQGRIANVIADTSSGKSTHVNRMVHHWIFHSPVTPTIVSLEATAAQYMLEMMSIHMEINLLWKMTSEEIKEFIKTERGQQIKNELCYKENGQPRFFILDDRAGSIKDLEAELEMLYRKHDSRLFVIDVLSDLLRGSSEQHAEDHMNFQRNMAKNGVTTVNVQHTRKPPQNADGKPRKVTEYDTLGTGSFVQSAAYNIVLNRDKLSEDLIEKNTTEVDLPKCRGGKTGSAGKWYYEFDKAKCHDLDDYFSGNRAA